MDISSLNYEIRRVAELHAHRHVPYSDGWRISVAYWLRQLRAMR